MPSSSLSIEDDSDLPDCLNTPLKRASWAMKLLNSQSPSITAVSTRPPDTDGSYSRTVIVRLSTNEEVVIQFRLGPLDLSPSILAREKLGALVPEIKHLHNDTLAAEGIWTYSLSCIEGMTWEAAEQSIPNFSRIPLLRSLGNILAKGFVRATSESAIEGVRRHLERIIAAEDPQIAEFREQAIAFLGQLDDLGTLPLFIAHNDLHESNIMVGEDLQITGLVDWGASRPLPFGMGFARVHMLTGEYNDGIFCVLDDFEEAENWQGIWEGLSKEMASFLQTKLAVVTAAMAIGTLLETFFVEDDGSFGAYNPVVARSLKRLLSYQVPDHRRVGESPYLEDT
ncbi:hypothetical protein ANO11243_084420 [Dothideomycetidae sp. 11243]|nr:hypothetical protein ANO11243_084420 [fungal sp. No.11243]